MKSKPQMWGFLLFPISVFLLLTTAGLGVLYSLLTLPFRMSWKALIHRWHLVHLDYCNVPLHLRKQI